MLIVSVPRSGHHLLTCMLFTACSGKTLRRKDMTMGDFRKIIKKGPLTYCEQYSHCRTVPCPDKPLIQKTHDLHLKDPVSSCILQVRDPVPASLSRFKIMVREGYKQDNLKRYRQFVVRNSRYAGKLVKKWREQAVTVIPYMELIEKPVDVLDKTLQILNLTSVMPVEDIPSLHNVQYILKKNKYHDPDFNNKLRSIFCEEAGIDNLKELNIEKEEL